MKMSDIRIMVVEKDSTLAHRISDLFPDDNMLVHREPTMDRVLERFESEVYEVLVITSSASKAGRSDGIELLEVISAKSPITQVLFLSEPRDLKTTMSAIKAGTFQYAKEPVSDEELKLLIETAVEQLVPYGKNLMLKKEKRRAALEELVGRSEPMQNIYRQIRQAAATDIPVLLLGETGTGKDLAAEAIHSQSERSKGPYVPVHLGALPPDLVSGELFGHEKGAFTGATEKGLGKFEQGVGGTVFLDEISTVDEKVQVSLLRLIEQKKFHRLGGRNTVSCDVRLIAASNQDLEDMVDRGKFREDLYYRLDVFRMTLPPLRERRDDIPMLIDEFLKRYNMAFQKSIAGISPECIGLLESYDWPGNVRELKNVIQRGVLVCPKDILLPEHLPGRFRPDRPAWGKITFDVGTSLEDIEREMIVRTIAAAGNNRTRAAQLLGISRRALYNKLRKHQIE
jgi:DNA-binding NtrC family response regulator